MSNGNKTTVSPGPTGSRLDAGTAVRVVTAAGVTRAGTTAAHGDAGNVIGVSPEGRYHVEFTNADGGSWIATGVGPDEIAAVPHPSGQQEPERSVSA